MIIQFIFALFVIFIQQLYILCDVSISVRCFINQQHLQQQAEYSYRFEMDNPFSIELDNKKFFTELASIHNEESVSYNSQVLSPTDNANRIRNMNKQLELLAKKREEMLFKEEQMNYIFKKQKPTLTNNFDSNNNDKKFRVRSLLKQKRESVNEFLNKKKQIYLANMNINIKKQQTMKLAQSIRDEEETLKARKLYFQNDVQFMQKFILGIKKQAEEAQSSVQSQLKQQEHLVSRVNGLEAEIQKMDNLIAKDTQILQSLEMYKKFIERFYDPDRNWKHYTPRHQTSEDVLFMTQGGANLPKQNDANDGMNFVIQYQPTNMLEVFVDAEESNIRQIQNLQDKQQELDNIVVMERQERAELQAVINQNEEKIVQLQRICAKKRSQYDQFKKMAGSNNDKVSVLEDQNLDIDKLSYKLFQIYKHINPKRSEDLQVGDKVGQMKRQSAELQDQIEKLRSAILHAKQNYSHLLGDVEKDFKNKIKRENLQKKQEDNRKLEIKKQQQQQKKRNQITNTKVKGRKDMEKVLLKKKIKQEKKDDGQKGDDDLKYLEEMGN